MKLRDALAGFALWTLAFVCVAGCVHLVSVLILPGLAPEDAYARLRRVAGGSGLVELPADAPALGPYRDPALATAACFYDLGRAPLRVKLAVDGEHVTTLSFHGRRGRVFYAMTDKAALRGRIDVVVLTAAEQAALEAEGSDEPSQDLRLVSPTPTGFVLVSMLVDRPDERAAAEARLGAVTCADDPASAGSGDD